MFGGVAQIDVGQALVFELDPPDLGGTRVGWEVAQLQVVAEEGGGRRHLAAEVVGHLRGNDHLDTEGDDGITGFGVVPEQGPRVHDLPAAQPETLGGLEEGVVGQQGQELDGVEDVRLSHRIGARYAGVGTEVDVESQQVLEPVDLESGEHGPSLGRHAGRGALDRAIRVSHQERARGPVLPASCPLSGPFRRRRRPAPRRPGRRRRGRRGRRGPPRRC